MPHTFREKYTTLKEGYAAGHGLEAEMERLRSNGLAIEGLDTVPGNQLRWLAGLTRLIDDEIASLDFWP
ncbi:hypothetical protein AAG596_08320, partial [Citromicrobium bathyomarinum]